MQQQAPHAYYRNTLHRKDSNPGRTQENRKLEMAGICEARIVSSGSAPNAATRQKNSGSSFPGLVSLIRLRIASRSISANTRTIPIPSTTNNAMSDQVI